MFRRAGLVLCRADGQIFTWPVPIVCLTLCHVSLPVCVWPQVKTSATLFRPVPELCPAKLTVTMALLQQASNFPGAAVLIQGFMSSSAVAAEDEAEQGPGEEGGVMLEQWLDAVLAASSRCASVQLEALAPLFFRLAVIFTGHNSQEKHRLLWCVCDEKDELCRREKMMPLLAPEKKQKKSSAQK